MSFTWSGNSFPAPSRQSKISRDNTNSFRNDKLFLLINHITSFPFLCLLVLFSGFQCVEQLYIRQITYCHEIIHQLSLGCTYRTDYKAQLFLVFSCLNHAKWFARALQQPSQQSSMPGHYVYIWQVWRMIYDMETLSAKAENIVILMQCSRK